MLDPIRRLPSEQTLRWASEAVPPGGRVTFVRRLAEGGWHANHALTVVDGDDDHSYRDKR